MGVFIKKFSKLKFFSLFFIKSNFYFILLLNKLILQIYVKILGGFLYKVITFGPICYFFTNESSTVFLICSSFFKFFNICRAVFDLLLKYNGFFCELDLQGLGYDIVRVCKILFRVFWGHSSYLYIIVPSDLIIFSTSKKEKQFLFFALQKKFIYTFVAFLLLLKGFSSYSMVGFFDVKRLIRLRSGKRK